MWPQINRYLPQFESAVLSGLDDHGQPFSLRCRPQPDGRGRLALDLPATAPLQPGPACLLCHRHDERLWQLKSFAVRGVLEIEAGGWRLRPHQFIPGAGIGGVFSYLRFLIQGRRATRRYLARRGLARPAVPWSEWMALLAAAQGMRPGSDFPSRPFSS